MCGLYFEGSLEAAVEWGEAYGSCNDCGILNKPSVTLDDKICDKADDGVHEADGICSKEE